jgi:hypothetical protein
MRRAWAEDAASQGFLVVHALPGLSTAILSSPITVINGKLVPKQGKRNWGAGEKRRRAWAEDSGMLFE